MPLSTALQPFSSQLLARRVLSLPLGPRPAEGSLRLLQVCKGHSLEREGRSESGQPDQDPTSQL